MTSDQRLAVKNHASDALALVREVLPVTAVGVQAVLDSGVPSRTDARLSASDADELRDVIQVEPGAVLDVIRQTLEEPGPNSTPASRAVEALIASLPQPNNGPQIAITLQSLAKWVGASGGLLTTFVIVQPWTMYYLGLLKPILFFTLSTTGLFFASIVTVRRRGHPHAHSWVAIFDRTTTEILWFIVGASFIGSGLLASWSQPTRQQVAQQILNDRGMFLQRIYYKTALEVGNTNGVALFHDAGFSPTLAFELLGEPAETVPDRRSLDVLLSLSDAELTDLLPIVTAAQPSAGHSSLVDNVVRYRTPDPRAAGLESAGQHITAMPSNGALTELLFSDGLPLLGHALLRGKSEIVDLLLSLGASARLAALPLARVDALPPGLHLLAVDPFLFVAERVSAAPTDASLRRTAMNLLNDFRALGRTPSTFANEALRQLRYSVAPRVHACQDLVTPNHFVGYRYSPQDGYSLGQFRVQHTIACTSYATHVEGQLQFDSSDIETALLTTTTDVGRSMGQTLAGLTVGVDASIASSEWAHFHGEVAASGNWFAVKRGDSHTVLAASTRSLGDARAEMAVEDQEAAVRCELQRPVFVTQAQTLECGQWAEMEWEPESAPAILSVTDTRTQERQVVMSMEDRRMLLRPGTYRASVVSLSEAATADDLRVAYAVSYPRVREANNEATIAGWPLGAFEIRDDILARSEQFVDLHLDQWAYVTVSLTDLESDVDVYLTDDTDSSIHYQSSKAGLESEHIRELLPPGRFVVRLAGREDASRYTLTLASMQPEVRRLGQINGRELQRVEVGGDEPGPHVFSFEVAVPTTVVVTVTPDESDIDVVLLDAGFQRLKESSRPGVEPEEIPELVGAGVYYIRVFPFDYQKPGGYTLTVGAAEDGLGQRQ